jgi:hypothetical protein
MKRESQKIYEAIQVAFGSAGLKELAKGDTTGATKNFTKLAFATLPELDQVEPLEDAIHYHNYIPTIKIEFTELAFECDPDFANVVDAFNICKQKTEEYDKKGQYPFNIALQLRFAGGSKAPLYFGHSPERKDFKAEGKATGPVYCYMEVVSAKGTPGFREFATDVVLEWMKKLKHPRPHWGKWFPYMNETVVATMHKSFADNGDGIRQFLKIRDQLGVDPNNMFVNDFIRDVVMKPVGYVPLKQEQKVPN